MFVIEDTYYFSSLTDFMLELRTTPRKEGRSKDSDRRGDRDWAGSESLDEAWNMFEEGRTDATGDKVLQNLEKLNLVNKRNTQFNDVVGFAANVPAYLMGVPKTMINRNVKIFRDKIVNVLVDTGANCNVSAREITRIATEILEVILKLEQYGYRVNLYRMIGSNRGSRVNLGFIKLKDDKERINLKKIMFPMTHPSMLRRLEFKFMETLPDNDFTHDGYGSARGWNKDIIKKAFHRACPGDFLFASVEDYNRNWYQSLGINFGNDGPNGERKDSHEDEDEDEE